MKRFLHALAALWPKKRATGSPPLPDPGTAIPQHLAAVLRMERALSGFANLPIHEFAEEAVGASALSAVRDQSTESPDTRLTDSPNHQIIESPNQQIIESPNHPTSLPRIPQPMPLLTILMLVFFMCLMAAKQASAQAEPAEAAENIIEEDLERFPMVKYDPDYTEVVPLTIGDSIPEFLWDLPLWVVNDATGRDTLTLREYEGNDLLVLDFWARWCAPCVGSMDKWESYANELNDGVKLIGVHLDFDYKALPFAQHKQWKSPQVIGEGAYILNRHFFDRDVISRMAWIQDGKLIAITSGRGYDLQTVADVVARRPVDIPMDYNWTYQPDNPGKP